jgi:plastocyanin
MVPPMKRVCALLAATSLTLPLVLGACGGDDKGTGNGGSSSSADLLVTAKDTLYDKKSYEMATGLKTIELKNQGGLTHTLLIEQDGKRVDEFKLATTPKKSDSAKVNLPPGTYTIYCDIVGHRASGMESTLLVK